MTHAEALSELIAEVDQLIDNLSVHSVIPIGSSLETALTNAKTALRYHRPHEHCYDRTNNERKD